MKIINKSREFTAKEIYSMTQDSAVMSVKNVEDGAILNVNGFIEFDDADKDGNATHILSLIGADNETGEVVVWACQSATFKRSFGDIMDIACDSEIDISKDPIAIQKISGKTNAGRDYVNCRWA